MDQLATIPEVMTLEEASLYLRLDDSAVERLARRGELPGRLAGKDWRFLKVALDDWLRGDDVKAPTAVRLSAPEDTPSARLIGQFGRFSGDETLDSLREEAYARRGRPEADRELAP